MEHFPLSVILDLSIFLQKSTFTSSFDEIWASTSLIVSWMGRISYQGLSDVKTWFMRQILRVSPSVLKTTECPCLVVFGGFLSWKVRKKWKTGKPVFLKIAGFSPDIKTDTIFGISDIENLRKHYSSVLWSYFRSPEHQNWLKNACYKPLTSKSLQIKVIIGKVIRKVSFQSNLDAQ